MSVPTPSVVLYHTYGGLEWATKYYLTVQGTWDDAALSCALAERQLMSNQVYITRWQGLTNNGILATEGAFTNMNGYLDGDIEPIHYALYLRFISPRAGRPSSKYIHGFTEQLSTNGAPSAMLFTQLSEYSTRLVTAGVQDSDGQLITGVGFRGFSRRRRMRRPSL